MPSFPFPPDPEIDSLLSHARIGRYGPFDFDRRWALDRQQEIIQAARYDRALEESCEFEALFVENALITKQPSCALPFIETLTESFARDQIADELTEVAKIKLGEREFGAVCAYAALRRAPRASFRRRLFPRYQSRHRGHVHGAAEIGRWDARKQFETDAIPLTALFPGQRYPSSWRASEIAAFHYDVARDPAAFDLDHAIRIIAAHAPRKIRLNWQQGPNTRMLAFKPFAADGHGDAVDFTWRLLKAGFGNELFRRVSNLPLAQADKYSPCSPYSIAKIAASRRPAISGYRICRR